MRDSALTVELQDLVAWETMPTVEVWDMAQQIEEQYRDEMGLTLQVW